VAWKEGHLFDLLKLMCTCTMVVPQARPSFEDILVILNTGAMTANDLHQ